MSGSAPQSWIGARYRVPTRLLRAIQCAAVAWAAVLVALMALRLGVDHVTITSPSGTVWAHLGRGKLACFVRGEAGPWSFRWDRGWNAFEVNEPSIYFHPKDAEFDLLGLSYVSGTCYMTPFTGAAVGVSYWYGVLLGGVVFGLCRRCLRRGLGQAVPAEPLSWPPDLSKNEKTETA